jgi:hypothetical protein
LTSVEAALLLRSHQLRDSTMTDVTTLLQYSLTAPTERFAVIGSDFA